MKGPTEAIIRKKRKIKIREGWVFLLQEQTTGLSQIVWPVDRELSLSPHQWPLSVANFCLFLKKIFFWYIKLLLLNWWKNLVIQLVFIFSIFYNLIICSLVISIRGSFLHKMKKIICFVTRIIISS